MSGKRDYNVEGQKDAPQRDFDPPHSSIREQVFGGLLDSNEQTKQKVEDIQSYRAGYENGKNQRK